MSTLVSNHFGRRRLQRIIPLIALSWAASNAIAQDRPVNPLRLRPPKSPSGATTPADKDNPSLPSAPAADDAAAAAAENGPLTASQIYELTHAAKSLDDYQRILHLCQEARQNASNDPTTETYLRNLAAWAFNRRGESWSEIGQQRRDAEDQAGAADADRRALADFSAAIQADPQRWKAYHNRGVSRAIAGELGDAQSDFNRVIELQPQYVNAWFNRAEVRYESGDYAAAATDYEQVLQRDSQDVAAWTGRAHCRLRLGQVKQAVEDYSQVIQIDPGRPEAYANRAEALQALGQWEAAATDFREALQRTPTGFEVFQAAAWFMSTCPEARYRSQALAVELAEKAIALAPEAPQVLDTLAAAYANAGDFAQATDKARQAADLTEPAFRAGIEGRLALYRGSRPYRQGVQPGESR